MKMWPQDVTFHFVLDEVVGKFTVTHYIHISPLSVPSASYTFDRDTAEQAQEWQKNTQTHEIQPS